MPASSTPSRCPLIRICWADSSPDTYSTLPPPAATCAAACMSNVDFPTPGSPPTRTRLPATISPSATGFEALAAFGRAAALPAAALRTWNSCNVFQAWQCGHCPAQRRLSPPQSVQTKVIVDLGMGTVYSPTHDGYLQVRT